MSDRLGIRELRGDLAATVRRAAAGQRVVITVGGTPTALIGPVDIDDGRVTLDVLAAAGHIVPPRRRDRPPVPEPIPAWVGSRLDRLLREVRG